MEPTTRAHESVFFSVPAVSSDLRARLTDGRVTVAGGVEAVRGFLTDGTVAVVRLISDRFVSGRAGHSSRGWFRQHRLNYGTVTRGVVPAPPASPTNLTVPTGSLAVPCFPPCMYYT